MERQKRLFARSNLRFEFIIPEEALHRWIGGRTVMSRQLQHLLEFAESRTGSLQVLPFSSGVHPGIGGPFVMTHSDDTGAGNVFLESINGDQLIQDDPDIVADYELRFSELSRLSLAPKHAHDLLRDLIDRLQQTG
jgi:hypothetical protein